MSDSFISSSWYRVALLRPALKPQVRIRRQRFRGEPWYVVHDPASGKFNRLSPAAYRVLGLMDGSRSMNEVWSGALELLGDDAPGQDEVIRLLSQLHAVDLLQCEATPDSTELFERFSRQDRQSRHAGYKNPFSIRIRLWDPDRFLERTLPYVRPLLGRAGALAYCILLAVGGTLAVLNWPELARNTSDRVLAAENLVILWLCFPLVKFLHEMGHAYATKAGGGEVHDMGVMLLVFMPVPYVDASAANGFRSRWRRTAVGAAGMMVELAIAALAMLLWAAAEPGLVRSVAFNVMLIAAVSTLFFNINPLLRLDGYYIFADLIELPNLAQSGNRYWRYLAERYLFRIKESEPPALTAGERRWLLAYTPLALLYRVFVIVAIVLYVATIWFFIGVALALWGVASMLIWPALKLAGYFASLPRAQGARRRALTASLASLAALLAFVLFVPLPLRTQTEGVVWLPEEALVRAGADGFVQTILARPGERTERRAALIESRNPAMEAQVAVQEAQVAELEAKLAAELFSDRVQAQVTRQDLERERTTLERLVERAGGLVARSGAHGRFVLPSAEDLVGRYVRKGDLLGYVTDDGVRIVRTVVLQDDVDLVRSGLVGAEVRLAQALGDVYPAGLVREVPAANDRLPSRVLSSEGGGAIAADPSDPRKALVSSFQFDLELPPAAARAAFGGRAYVRFLHRPEPLAAQWYRRLRQTFLARFHV